MSEPLYAKGSAGRSKRVEYEVVECLWNLLFVARPERNPPFLLDRVIEKAL